MHEALWLCIAYKNDTFFILMVKNKTNIYFIYMFSFNSKTKTNLNNYYIDLEIFIKYLKKRKDYFN